MDLIHRAMHGKRKVKNTYHAKMRCWIFMPCILKEYELPFGILMAPWMARAGTRAATLILALPLS